MGYHRAGFEVVGVDINPQPHYPFEFHQADAMTYPLDGFDAIHASPPCQGYSRMRFLPWLAGKEYPLLIDPMRDRLTQWGGAWVIENVEGAPLTTAPGLFGIHGIKLCGTMFGLGVYRHRPFESSVILTQPEHPAHHEVIQAGRNLGNRCRVPVRKGISAWQEDGGCAGNMGNVDRVRQAMDIDWMTGKEIAQAIPPAYTEWIGTNLMAALTERAGLT